MCAHNSEVAQVYISFSEEGLSAGLIAAIVIIIILLISAGVVLLLYALKRKKGEYKNLN